MRLIHLHFAAAFLALCSGPAWPGTSGGLRDSAASGPGAAVERILKQDAFRSFLRENRSREDSLQYRQGEVAYGQEELALALGHHLAADLPAAGDFRKDLLAQRSRIFARLWPIAASPAGAEEGPDRSISARKPAFEWGVGAEHSHGVDWAGPFSPYERNGTGYENGDWRYRTHARLGWPVSLVGKEWSLGLSANAIRSSLGAASGYEAALEAETPEGMLENLFLSLSAGFDKSRDWGSRRYYGLLAAKAWYFEDGYASLETGYSAQWDGGNERLNDNGWAKASREFPLTGGNAFHASLETAAIRQVSRAELYSMPILFAGDVSHSPPSQFQGPEFHDSLPGNGPNALSQSPAAGEKTLALEAPLSYFSFSPSLGFAFTMPAGLQARAGAWYALHLYPEYAWDRIPWPDTLDPYSGDVAGLALNRSDGRYYPALLVGQDGNYQGYFGTAPLEHHKTRRVDNRIGLDFKLGKVFPRGYSMSAESTLEFGWTNLARTAPVAFRPWQWGLALNVSRSVSGQYDQF